MRTALQRIFCTSLLLGYATTTTAAELYSKRETWTETLLAARERLTTGGLSESERSSAAVAAWYRFKEDFPVQWDWTLQDAGERFPEWFAAAPGEVLDRTMVEEVVAELGQGGKPLEDRLRALVEAKAPQHDPKWLELYAAACEARRAERLRTLLAESPRVVFTKHPTLRPSFFAYTEGQSDAQHERHFAPGSELCLLEFQGVHGKVRTLLADPAGAIRDPAVSWDAGEVLFAWKKSLDDDDYHLYGYEVTSGRVRQLTQGLGFADYEPAWLPNGDIVFASTRCVQTVDCWWTEVSNLYTCAADGRFLRRLGFDQVHTIYPQVLDDGRVIYTRWDYNDRGQIFTQALFQMRPDGTAQAEFYGNNSWFPTTIAHARGIPGTEKVLAILCGHHSSQAGKLAVIDPARGRQENSGVQLVAPVRPTAAERIDDYGQHGELWQYPYPLNEDEFLTGYAPLGWDRPEYRRGDADFGIYWMDRGGRRELLAWDRQFPCSQPVPLVARPRPHVLPSSVDYNRNRGTYYVRDVYAGDGLAGVRPGTIKKLRVVALAFRPAGIGHNGSAGPGGGALVSTPISVGNGSWDVKTVLGEATVREDGSALFSVPARTPVYFQALDERGFVVQTMRSWSTLQPGEVQGCIGCHENKNTSPDPAALGYAAGSATTLGPEELGQLTGLPPGFSFLRQIQPILDRHCVRCHYDRQPVRALLRGPEQPPVLANARPAAVNFPSGTKEIAFSLLSSENHDPFAQRKWSDSYLVLTQSRMDAAGETQSSFQGTPSGRMVNWITSQSPPEPLPPRSGGAVRSELLNMLDRGHKGVKLTANELRTIACWIDLVVPYCGDYREANTWSPADLEKFERYAGKRARMEASERANIRQLLENASRLTASP